MSTTDLKLEREGSLQRPGPVGRLVRIVFGLLCVYYVNGLWIQGSLITASATIKPIVWNGILPGLFLVSYVINIGYSRAWKKWPAVASVALLSAAALYGYVFEGTLESLALAHMIFAWELYIFLHLGLAFLLAGWLATPGCEMRSFHHLYSKITGRTTKEHICPVGPLTAIDKWEAARRTSA